MDVMETIAQARDAITVRRVFGEPYERDGVTVIPAARCRAVAGEGVAKVGPRWERAPGAGSA